MTQTSLVNVDRLTQTFSLSKILLDFGSWLEKTKDAHIFLKRRGKNQFDLDRKDVLVLPYLHRFKSAYVYRTIRKFERIIERNRGKPYVHLTLTCYRSFDIAVAIERLKKGWNRLKTFLVKRHGENLSYVAVMEPHKDGYPHLHVLIFTSKFLMRQSELTVLWQKYGVGRITYLKRYWNWGRDSKGLHYVSKYLNKYYKDVPKVLKFLNGQTKGFRASFENTVVFYAVLWKCRFKTYSFSHDFSGLWIRATSGEWELWLFCWTKEMFDHIFKFYGVRFNHQIDDFFEDPPGSIGYFGV